MPSRSLYRWNVIDEDNLYDAASLLVTRSDAIALGWLLCGEPGLGVGFQVQIGRCNRRVISDTFYGLTSFRWTVSALILNNAGSTFRSFIPNKDNGKANGTPLVTVSAVVQR